MFKSVGPLGSVAVLAVGVLVGCAKPQQGALTAQTSDTRIIGGQDAVGTEDFAQTTALLYNVAEGSICTATILHPEVLLTAAHCLTEDPGDLRVAFGPEIESAAKSGRVRAVVTSFTSPLWQIRHDKPRNNGDIAVVKFAGGLPEGFKPAKILSDATKLSQGQVLLLAGYGITNGVTKAGAGKLRSVESTLKDLTFSKTEFLVDQSQGKGACHGDSGGPAYLRINGELFVAGVTSRGVGDENQDCSVVAAYTSVPEYAQWLGLVVQSMTGSALETQSLAGEAQVTEPTQELMTMGL